MPSGAQLFAESLTRLGIDTIFTLVGDHLNEALAEIAKAGIRIIDFRHESGVTHAADAWARVHRRPALALVTGGPGHTNSLTGVATAQLNSSPLIAVSGSRASTAAERQAFQDIDQVSMTRPVVKWAAEPPTAGEIPFYLGRAYAEAASGRMGAVHLTIPVNLFEGQAASHKPAPLPPPRPSSRPSTQDVEHLMRLLRAAERPVIVAGSGAWWSDAGAELAAFIERTSIPLYTITMGRGVVPDSHPLCLGYADPAMNKSALRAFQEADLMLVLGKRIDFRMALGGPRLIPPGLKMVQLDIHQPELGMNRALELGICADLKATLGCLLEALGEESWEPRPWLERVRELRREWDAELAATSQDRGSPVHPAAFFTELAKALPADVLYAWDGGDFVHWGRARLPARIAGGWLRLGPLGTIGSALPNAVALQLAHPGRPVLLPTGDGSLGFYIAELDTLVRYELPVVIVVGNDGGWGLERELQRDAYGMDETVACELRRTRYDLIMKGFGGEGEHIERLEQVAPAVERAFASGKPYLLNVEIRGSQSPFTQWQIAGKKK